MKTAKSAVRATHPSKQATRRPAAGRDRRQLEVNRATRKKATSRRKANPPTDYEAGRKTAGMSAADSAVSLRGHIAAVELDLRRKLSKDELSLLKQRFRAAARKKNPPDVDAAAALSESFHGRPARTVREVTEVEHSRSTLSDLGRLVSLTVWLDEDNPVELTFKGVRLTSSPDGGQLYFTGNQSLDLAALGLDANLPKDHLTIGPAASIVYYTSKAFHNFEPCEYEHQFGEEGGTEPTLNYDVLSEKCYLSGGTYQVRPEGIVN